MKKIISAELAGKVLVFSLGLLVIFDVLVLIGVIPAGVVWGGQIAASSNTLLLLEIIALLVTLIFAVLIAAKLDYIQAGKFKTAVRIGIWVLFAYLLLNTLGDLASRDSFEKLIFAPLTLLLAFFALRLAIEK